MQKKKIVVIDDECGIRDTIHEILEFHGFDVKTASNGITGLVLITDFNPDLVICDVMMSDMNIWEVLKSLRKDAKFSNLPFLFISAKIDPDMTQIDEKMGPYTYLSKPFITNDLMQAIEQHI